MKTTEEILLILQDFKPYAEKNYGVKVLGVFGSVARNEQTEQSDIDICYEGKALSLISIDKLQKELEERLGGRVDIVRLREGMNPVFSGRIKKEVCYV